MSSALDSVPAFTDRAEQIGVERWIIDKLVEKSLQPLVAWPLLSRTPRRQRMTLLSKDFWQML